MWQPYAQMLIDGTSPLVELSDGPLSTPTASLPYQHSVLLRSFVLERPHGNVIIYDSPGVSSSAEAIRDLGGAERLLMNHSHEAMYGTPSLDVPVYVHELDRAEVARDLPVADASARRDMIAQDLAVIPTPGHTAGTTSFLWDNCSRRFQFTGDFIRIDHGE